MEGVNAKIVQASNALAPKASATQEGVAVLLPTRMSVQPLI
jgi:hypothetical protein